MDEQTIQIQVKFTKEVDGVSYTDALYFTPEDYEKTDQKQIDTLKQERVDNWVQAKNTPQVVVEPTKEELEQQKQLLQDQVAQLDIQIAEKLKVIEPVKGK